MVGFDDTIYFTKAHNLMSLNQAEFRKAMGCFATGVTIITVDLEGEVHGMTANAFASVSLDPLLVLVCVDHKTRTHAHLHAKKRFGINVLSRDQRARTGHGEDFDDDEPGGRNLRDRDRSSFDHRNGHR